MNIEDEVSEVEKKLKASGLKVDDVLRLAKVDRSTWTRWKSGASIPRLDTWRSVERAILHLTHGETL